MSGEFFSELDYSPATIQAAMAEGIVQKWRCDGAGVQWFKSTGRPLIRAVPPAVSTTADDDAEGIYSVNDDDDDDDDDTDVFVVEEGADDDDDDDVDG